MAYVYLLIAIICEVIGTSFLKASNEFKEWLPSLIVLVGYGASFYFMALSMKKIPLGTVYATWSGLGIILVALVGIFYYNEKIDAAGVVGMGLIIAGVLVMNLLSKSNLH